MPNSVLQDRGRRSRAPSSNSVLQDGGRRSRTEDRTEPDFQSPGRRTEPSSDSVLQDGGRRLRTEDRTGADSQTPGRLGKRTRHGPATDAPRTRHVRAGPPAAPGRQSPQKDR
eukprot:gene9161-biopygen4841